MTTNNNQNNQNNNAGSPFGTGNNNNNQNNNAGSRFGNANNNNNQNNQNNNTNSRFGGSRFSNANNNNNQNNNTPFSGASRFNRFGQQTIYWTVAPMNDAVVRISLNGLGDPFHRLLGTPLKIEYGDPEKVVLALQSDEELMEKISEVLEESWKSYQYEGTSLLFPWDEDVKKAYSQPVFPNDNMPQNDNNANNQQNQTDDIPDWLDALTDNVKSNVTCLRAIDLAFVLNILARSRANVVVGNTPLALEPGFLTQTVVCEDPRIVALARATGCIDENW